MESEGKRAVAVGARQAGLPYTVGTGGLSLAVRLTPKASKNSVAGIIEMPDGRFALSIRIAAPPVDGAANTALIAFLTKSLSVRKADVTILSGETSRLKILRIQGDVGRIAGRLRELVEQE